MSNDIPDMEIDETGRGGLRLSIVWLVPVVAVAVALGIAWKTYNDRGPMITVAFKEASGITPGQTELRYRQLGVGLVEDLTFGEGLSSVLAHIRLDKEIAPYVDDGSQFWVVEPQVSLRGVSGIETVLSGVYIEGAWDTEAGQHASAFKGLDTPPLAPADQDGTIIKLRAPEGGRVQNGAPVVYRGVTVGHIDTPKLEEDGTGVSANAFIQAPYDKLINSNTQFWGLSGVSFDVGRQGLNISIGNLASLVQGGVTFGTILPGGVEIENGRLFTVFPDEETARSNVFAMASTQEVLISTFFKGSVSGLALDAPVELSGIEVGRVAEMGSFIAEDGGGITLRVDMALLPGRLGLPAGAGEADVSEYLQEAVEGGLFAELQLENQFSGGLKIALVTPTGQVPGTFDADARPFAVMPALPVDPEALQSASKGLTDRLADLPVEDLLREAVNLLSNVNALVTSDGVQQAPDAAVALLDGTREKVDAFDPAPLMSELEGAAGDARDILGTLGSEQNLANVEGALAQVEPLLSSARVVADKAAALELEAMVTRITATVDALNALVAAPQTQALPATVEAALTQARDLLASDALQALPGQAGTAVASASAVLQRIEASAAVDATLAAMERLDPITASVQTTMDGLPEITAQLSAVLREVEALELQPLVASATSTVQSADTLLSAPETQALPGTLNATLTDAQGILGSDAAQALPQDLADALNTVQALLAQVEQSQGLVNTLAAMERLDRIAASVETTTDGLPELREQTSQLLAKAEALPVQDVVASAEAILDSGAALLQSPDTQGLPGTLNMALTELAASLQELRDGGAVTNVNTTLASAASAAQALEGAAVGLPELSQRLNDLVSTGEALLATYGDRSAFNLQALSLLNDLRAAAKATTALARTIERNPSSLILGR